MPPYCISSRLSRRRFLKLLLAGCLPWFALPMLELPSFGLSARARQSKDLPGNAPHPLRLAHWREPVWILDLASHRMYSPDRMPVPHGMPGSLMKLVAATALLEEHLLGVDELLHCHGVFRTSEGVFRCREPHGALSIREAIGLSCNLFFARAATRLSAPRFLAYARRFRLDSPSDRPDDCAVDAIFRFPREADPSRNSAAYALGLHRNLQPNAVQLARMAAMIARRDIPGIRPQTWRILQEGMRLAVSHGTAAGLDPDNRWHIAAKTGTTEHGHAFQSWLIGYFPDENPRYAFCCRAPSGTSKDGAVPLMRDFLRHSSPSPPL